MFRTLNLSPLQGWRSLRGVSLIEGEFYLFATSSGLFIAEYTRALGDELPADVVFLNINDVPFATFNKVTQKLLEDTSVLLRQQAAIYREALREANARGYASISEALSATPLHPGASDD